MKKNKFVFTFLVLGLLITPFITKAYSFQKDLNVGSKGTDVTELQKYLVSNGYLDSRNVTGTFGRLTLGAVKKLQVANKFPSTSGAFGPKTRALLNNLSKTKNKNTFTSVTYGYSISYSGIDAKYVYIVNDGKNINLFPDQSNIDDLEISDSPYSIPSYMTPSGTATFGINQFQKFKGDAGSRHTYYLKTGLKNNKSIMISVENDSDIPNYFDLASLKFISNEVTQNCSTWSVLNGIKYPSCWKASSIMGGSYGTASSVVGTLLKPSDNNSENITIGGLQYGCENVNVSGGVNPTTKAYCVQSENGSPWIGKYITTANQGTIYGIPMVTTSVDSQVLNVFDQIVQYNSETSTEIFNNQPGAIKSTTDQGNNQWTLAIDLLSSNPEWLPGVNEKYLNQNTKIRNLIVTKDTKTYNCGIDSKPSVLQNVANYITSIQKYIAQAKLDSKNRVGGSVELMTDWRTLNFNVNGNNITAIYDICLP